MINNKIIILFAVCIFELLRQNVAKTDGVGYDVLFSDY